VPVDRLAARSGRPRAPGARALRTRERLLECTAALVRELPYRELTTAEVTQRLGLSPPAFYRYFADIDEAILELAGEMRETVRGIARCVREGSWEGPECLATASAVVDAMAAFWARHRALYRVTDLLAEEGDPRFRRVKSRTFAELTQAFCNIVSPADHDPFTVASVVVTTLIHTVARERGFQRAGVKPQSLRLYLARALCTLLLGDASSAAATDAAPARARTAVGAG
jgi:AcrR family transcriptional regulator